MKKLNIHTGLFILALILYLFVTMINIENFPIYFFCDEAIQAIRAEELLQNNFRDQTRRFMPLIMKGFHYYNLGITPYFHMPAVLLFGKNVWSVRTTTVILGLFACIFVSLITKKVFKLKNYWSATLYLITIPIFFIHVRTGFEMALATSLYAGFIFFYLLYRTKKPVYLLPALLFSALSFYSYAGTWLPIITSFIIFSILDLPYHFKHKKIALLGIIFTVVLYFPLFNFHRQNPEIFKKVLKVYNADVVKNISLKEKTNKMFVKYLTAFNPKVLFIYDSPPVPQYVNRHRAKGYGYFPLWSLPIVAYGLVYLFFSFKKPFSRIILVSLLTSGLSAFIEGFVPTRNLLMVINITCLFCLGLKLIEKAIQGLTETNLAFTNKTTKCHPRESGDPYNRSRIKCGMTKYKTCNIIQNTFSFTLFSFLSIITLYLAYDCIINGPTWYTDYGLYGIQYGARQLFSEVDSSLDQYKIAYVTADFANGTDVFVPFFLNRQKAKRTRVIGGFDNPKVFRQIVSTTDKAIFFGEPHAYKKLKQSGIFKRIGIKKTLFAPDLTPAFYKFEAEYR